MTNVPYRVFKETELPADLEPHGIYLVAPPSSQDYLEIYVTNAQGDAHRRVPTEADIQEMVSQSASGSDVQQFYVVDSIAARDALAPDMVVKVYVVDATADSTVDAGGAVYIFDHDNGVWIKTAEDESMDLVLTWASIVGGPSSSPTDIDAAVSASHTHSNMDELEKISEDADGHFLYDGNMPVTAWASVGW